MARVLKGSHSFTCTPHVHLLTYIRSIPAFAFPAEAGPHLPTPEGWKAELAWVASGQKSAPDPARAVPHSHCLPSWMWESLPSGYRKEMERVREEGGLGEAINDTER